MPKLTTFMYGMIISIAVFTVLFSVGSKLIVNYNVPIPAQHNATFVAMTNMTAINEQTADLKAKALKEDVNKTTGFFGQLEERFDILGLYFQRGYKTAQIIPRTTNIFFTMVDAILDSNLNLFGIATVSLRFMIMNLVLVAIIGVIIALLVKWWV